MKLDDEHFRRKARELIPPDDISMEDGVFDVTAPMRQRAYLLLKEVNRDTRHACSEVRAENPYQGQVHEQASDYPEYFDKGFQAGQEAHARACMNVGGWKP